MSNPTWLETRTRVGVYGVITDDAGRLLVCWYNGGRHGEEPLWTLPGGGLEWGEQIEDCLARELVEETGLDIEIGSLLATDCVYFDEYKGMDGPIATVRLLYRCRVVGGTLGTTEIDGSTDFACWKPLDDVLADPHARLVEVAASTQV